MDTLGDRIKHARIEAKIDRKKLAAKVGMPYSTLADIENNNTSSCTTTAQLAYVLGVSAFWLATGQGEMRPDGTAPALTPKETAYIGLFRGLTESQQEEEIRRLTEKKQTNDAILAELTNPARRRA